MIRLVRQLAAVARRDARVQRTYGISSALGLLASGFGLFSYHFVGRLVPAGAGSALPVGGYFAFVCTGLMLHLMVMATLSALGSALAREAVEGTLEPALTCGVSPAALVAGATVVPLGLALVQAVLYAGAGSLIGGVTWSQACVATALVILTATLIACAPLGLVGAALWLVTRRPGVVTLLATFAFGILGGVYFPVALLPAPLRALSDWVPLAVGLSAFRSALLDGAGFAQAAPALGRLALVSLVTFPPAVLALRFAFDRARHRGSLALV
ncbi:MAG TPA: ABC transporter permease [Myxococcota bacterium]|nr:ABC transporter permease [Myxococcota bacterium]